MKRNPLFCNGFWPFLFWLLLLPFILLLIVLAFEWHVIEDDVANNATNDLKSVDINWATVETFNDGRTATIKGVAPNKDEAELALDIVKNAKGVHIAKFQHDKIEIQPASPAYLNAIVTANSIVLRGTLQDQDSIDRLLNEAYVIYGKDNVVNKLNIGENTSPLGQHKGLLAALYNKGNSAPFSASFVDGGVTLNGQVVNSDQKRAIGNKIARIVNVDITNNINVVLPIIKRDECLDLVNELLSKGKINFETGKSLIHESSNKLLQSIANIAERCPKSSFEISGHTDSTGRLESNMQLSQKRAQAVVDHLANLGLNSERFRPVGYGPNKPFADNETVEGREKNRRIEFLLIDDVQQEKISNN